MKLSRNLGTLLLGCWLILSGLVSLTHLSFNGLWLIMAILALASGLLLVAGR